MAYRDFKHLSRKTASDKAFSGKAYSIAKNPKYNGYLRVLAWMIYKFCDKTLLSSGIKNENMSNQELAEELHKLIIRKFE